MINNVALISVFFDYPETYKPSFYKNALKYFEEKDIHILRYNDLMVGANYYDKLYFHKVIKLYEYIQENLIGKYDYILFLDATDTNFYTNPENIVDKFKATNHSIVFCAEKGLWPLTKYSDLYETKRKDSPIPYLNSGAYIGYVDKISDYLKEMIEKDHHKDDQGSWQIQYLLNEDILVDQECNFFFSTYKTKEYINLLSENNVELIGINPFIIHDNGPWGEDSIKLTEILNK